MSNTLRSGIDVELRLECILQRVRRADAQDMKLLLHDVLDVAIEVAAADMGTLQRYDRANDCLQIVASEGFAEGSLKPFEIVRRNTNSTCAAAFTRRMRVIVDDVTTNYIFVGTKELELMQVAGIAAAHSTPIIASSGRLCGVFTTHFREPQRETRYDPAPLDRLAVHLADHLDAQWQATSEGTSS
jgi:GAF domain-containing protein